MEQSELKIPLDDFIQLPKKHLESLHTNETKSIIILDGDKKCYTITPYEYSQKDNKEESSRYKPYCNKCCNDTWETIGYFAVIIVIIISINFGN